MATDIDSAYHYLKKSGTYEANMSTFTTGRRHSPAITLWHVTMNCRMANIRPVCVGVHMSGLPDVTVSGVASRLMRLKLTGLPGLPPKAEIRMLKS